ncbi:MAG: hypothetical protein R2795_25095, partial [Saprospiraceae bacterium]
MTAQGFHLLTAKLLECGIAINPAPIVEVGPSMLSLTEKLLRRKIVLNPYEALFTPPPDTG